jgi:cytochrome bd ubiquinol oxidase subunit I
MLMESPVIDNTVVELSRLQFGITAIYHFLLAPLTLGLSSMLFIMKAVYVVTHRKIYQGRSQWRHRHFAG